MARRKIGPFQIEEQLGVGGMGIVYRAIYLKTGQEVAVKVLSPAMSEDEGVQKRFAREMEILKRLQHKNIVQYFGGGTVDGQHYYAMEIMDGGTLDTVLQKKGRLSWEQTIDVARAITRGLEYAHYKGIIHRDLKPANLFLSKKGELKLGDFGIARDTERTALTAAGKTVGTYAYMAPEQISGKPPVSRKTDLYALGCVIFQMLTGQPPFEADNAAQMLMQHLELKPPRVGSLAPDCPIWLERIVMKLLEKDPEDRYYDALAVHTALGDVRKKVAEQTSVSKQTAAGDITVPMSKEDNRELRQLLGRKRKKKKKAVPFYERVWFLTACLVLLIAGVTWMAWPLSDEQRFQRGQELMERAAALDKDDDDRATLMMEARDKYFKPLIESSPDGPHAKEVDGFLLTIETDRIRRRVEMTLHRARQPKSEAERHYREGRKAQKNGDRLTALDQYRSLITLVKGRKADRPYVILAKRRIAEIHRAGSGGNDSREIVLENLEKADRHIAKGETIEADAIYSAIINVYQNNLELEPLVHKAEAALRKLRERE